MTRTFFWKNEPTQEERTMHNIVRRANEEAEAMLPAPGFPSAASTKGERHRITEAGIRPLLHTPSS